MKENIVAMYIRFKKITLMECCNILHRKDFDEIQKKRVFETYINTYLACYYYHVLETLNEKDVIEYNYDVIIKELKGKYEELMYNLKNDKKINDVKVYQNHENLIKKAYTISLFSILFDLTDFSKCNTLTDTSLLVRRILEKNQRLIDITKINENTNRLSTLLFERNKKEEQFFQLMMDDNFILKLDNYQNDERKCRVSLDYDIKQIERSYKRSAARKIFQEKELSEDKFLILLNLLNAKVLNEMKEGGNRTKYFISLPKTFLSKKEKFQEVLSMINTPYQKKHIILTIESTTYNSAKAKFKLKEKDYSFAMLLNISRVSDVDKKIAEVKTIPFFDYIIIDQFKQEQLPIIKSYQDLGENIWLNDIND